MLDDQPISVLIPALDEEACIGAVVRSLPRDLVDEVVVVDNGSRDRTSAVARAAGARVLHEPRRGYGHALTRGLSTLGRDGIVVFMDGDGADDPADLPALLEPFRHGADLVLGQREHHLAEAGATTWPQRVGNRLVLSLVARLAGHPFADLGPFRAIRAEALARLSMRQMTYGWTLEMQIKAASRGLAVREVPVRHRARRAGRSKVSGNLRAVLMAGLVMPSAAAGIGVSERIRARLAGPQGTGTGWR